MVTVQSTNVLVAIVVPWFKQHHKLCQMQFDKWLLTKTCTSVASLAANNPLAPSHTDYAIPPLPSPTPTRPPSPSHLTARRRRSYRTVKNFFSLLIPLPSSPLRPRPSVCLSSVHSYSKAESPSSPPFFIRNNCREERRDLFECKDGRRARKSTQQYE